MTETGGILIDWDLSKWLEVEVETQVVSGAKAETKVKVEAKADAGVVPRAEVVVQAGLETNHCLYVEVRQPT
jgi:hypothetical protein